MADTTATSSGGMSFGLLVAYLGWVIVLGLASYGAYSLVGFIGHVTGSIQ